jgi:uncharacterized protein (UPF0210 family)
MPMNPASIAKKNFLVNIAAEDIVHIMKMMRKMKKEITIITLHLDALHVTTNDLDRMNQNMKEDDTTIAHIPHLR